MKRGCAVQSASGQGSFWKVLYSFLDGGICTYSGLNIFNISSTCLVGIWSWVQGLDFGTVAKDVEISDRQKEELVSLCIILRIAVAFTKK